MEKLFNKIDELQPVYKQLWKDMVAIETPSRNEAQINKLVDLIQAFAQGRGFVVNRFPSRGMGDYITVGTACESKKQPFTFMGHMDTVHPIGLFGPEVLKEEDGWLYGPGAVDCKGGLVCAMLTMEALTACGYEERPLKLIMTPDEEISSPTSREFIQEQNTGSAALFNCETGTDGKLVTGRKGIYKIKVEVTGKASHAGNDYFGGVSAIRECCLKILTIEGLSQEGGTTYNCGVIQGGTVSNVVAEKCWFEVDIRAVTQESMDEAVKKVCSIAEHCTLNGAVGKAILPERYRPPFAPNMGTDLLFERIRAVGHHYGIEELTPMQPGGGSDIVFAAQVGVPGVCSIGVCGTGTHSVREKADISSLARRAKLMGATIWDYAKALEY